MSSRGPKERARSRRRSRRSYRRLTVFWARNGWFPIKRKEQMGYGLVGILVIILLIVLIFYFVRRA